MSRRKKKPAAEYYVYTYDADVGDYTVQDGVPEGPWTKWGLREAIRLLRECGYPSDRYDNFVLISDERIECHEPQLIPDVPPQQLPLAFD